MRPAGGGEGHLTRRAISLAAGLAILAAFAFVEGSASSAVACDRYASPTGQDADSGTLSQPFRTVDRLVHSMSSGETGCLLGYPDGSAASAAGLYEEGPVNVDVPGITLRSAEGQVAQIKGRVVVTASNVTISHLVLDGRSAAGAASPRITGNDVKLAHNHVTSRNTADCITVAGNAQRAFVTHNRVHDCKRAVHVESGRYAFIADNLVYDNAGTGMELSPAADSSYVWHNVIDGNRKGIVWGSGVLPGDTLVSTSDQSVASGNVVSSSDDFNVTAEWHDPDGGGPAGPVAGTTNALFANCAYHGSRPQNGIDSSVTSQSWNAEKIWAPSNTGGNPQYADAARGDFRLGPASPCRAATGGLTYATADDGPGADDERPSELEAINLRPNVLIVMTDDQRADGTLLDAVMPDTRDWFRDGTPSGAPGGTQFTQAFATTPLCCPSRSTIFTGQYVHNHGVTSNDLAPPPTVDPDNPTYRIQPHTIQRYLRDRAGYRTGLFGKFLNSWRFSTAVLAPHFDDFGYFQGAPQCPFRVMEDPGAFRELGSPPVGDPLHCEVNSADDYSTTWVGQEGLRFIDEAETQADEKPWLLYLTPTAPHNDNLANVPVPEEQYASADIPPPGGLVNSPGFQEGLRADGDQLTDKPQSVRSFRPACDPAQPVSECDAQWTAARVQRRAEQLRTLMSVDDMVQAVFTKLRQTGEDDDTLAFFLSDNGQQWGEHGLTGKERPYLETVKVPLMMRWPDNPVVRRGVTDPRLVGNVDIAPTILDAVDVTPDHVLDGRSLLDPDMSRSHMLTESWRNGVLGWTSLTGPDHQYTEYYASPDAGFVEYYRFPQDIDQVTNLFGDGDPSDPPASETDPLAAGVQAGRTCTGSACP